MLSFAPHPSLHAAAFTTTFPAAIESIPTSPEVLALLSREAETPASLRLPDDEREVLRGAVRDVLRHGGHKPTGRGKPSAEYLVRARGEVGLPEINAAVDACNAVSVHSLIPISVVDLDRAEAPFRVDVVPEGSYVFNASGQEIRLNGLLCLFDKTGPCANAVKDSHGTKTHPGTTRTLSVLWGPSSHRDHVETTLALYMDLLRNGSGATVERAV